MPTPANGESKGHYISRCVREVMAEGRDQKAAVGKCEGLWAEHKKTTMKLFTDCIKDATVQSVHQRTAIGNALMGAVGRHRNIKDPDSSLEPDDGEGDIVRAEKSMPFEVKKTDPDKQLVFGWASVVERDGRLIVDKQGDMIPVHELENAAYDFVLYSRDHGDMHRNVGVGKMVESMVFTTEKQQLLGIDLGMVGWWTGFKINDPDTWAAHKRGDRLEFSIGGMAVPVEVKEGES